MPEAQSQEIRLGYDDHGRGEPALLFMPGWCGSRRVFDELARRCAEHRRTLSLDWRGHGTSARPTEDFGAGDLADDALAVIDASKADRVVPVTLSHAGWVAIELRRRLGARIPKLVLLDWIVLDAPPPFLGALQSLQDPLRWQQTREQLFSMWLHGLNVPELTRYVREDMGSYPFDMWARAGREISAAYTQLGSPLRELAGLDSPLPVLHLYAQPEDAEYLAAQEPFIVAGQDYAKDLDIVGEHVTALASGEMTGGYEVFPWFRFGPGGGEMLSTTSRRGASKMFSDMAREVAPVNPDLAQIEAEQQAEYKREVRYPATGTCSPPSSPTEIQSER